MQLGATSWVTNDTARSKQNLVCSIHLTPQKPKLPQYTLHRTTKFSAKR